MNKLVTEDSERGKIGLGNICCLCLLCYPLSPGTFRNSSFWCSCTSILTWTLSANKDLAIWNRKQKVERSIHCFVKYPYSSQSGRNGSMVPLHLGEGHTRKRWPEHLTRNRCKDNSVLTGSYTLGTILNPPWGTTEPCWRMGGWGRIGKKTNIYYKNFFDVQCILNLNSKMFQSQPDLDFFPDLLN